MNYNIVLEIFFSDKEKELLHEMYEFAKHTSFSKILAIKFAREHSNFRMHQLKALIEAFDLIRKDSMFQEDLDIYLVFFDKLIERLKEIYSKTNKLLDL